MFVDQARRFVKGGDGGNGAVAFRREKYVPQGGPSGGDGGRGANVVFQAEAGLRTLMDFRYRRHYKGRRGEHGKGKNMHGPVPLIWSSRCRWGRSSRMLKPVQSCGSGGKRPDFH